MVKSGKAPANKRSPKQGGRQYSIETAPVSIGNRTFMTSPKVRRSADGHEIHTHSEYIADITGNTAPYAIARQVSLNPGLATSFPWLNQIASRFESYKFRKLNFRFMTERPTTESGYVALVPDYDPTDPAPESKTSAFQYQSAAKCAPWENLVQVNLPSNLLKRKEYFVRQGSLTSAENLALYDTGNLWVLVGGNTGSVNLGELWCDYEVELITPQLDSNYGSSDSAKIVGATAQTAALPFGTAPASTFSRENLWTYDPVTGAITFLRPYQGLFSAAIEGTVISAVSVSASTAVVSVTTGSINAAGTGATYSWVVGAQEGQTLDVATTATTITSAVMRVGSYRASLG